MKHIEITWSNGDKTIEGYDPNVCINNPTTAQQIFDIYRAYSSMCDVKAVSYKEID